MKKISKVGVLGGGLMGSGIAQVSAAAGFPTAVREVSEALCAKSRQAIEKTLAKGIERGKVTEAERDATLGKLRFVTELKELADSDILIEAVVEDLEVKNSLFSQLDKITRPDAIFASNTSSLTIIAMAAASGWRSSGRLPPAKKRNGWLWILCGPWARSRYGRRTAPDSS